MSGKRHYPFGTYVLNGVLFPAAIVAWAIVVVLAMLEKPSEPTRTAFDDFSRVILTGHQ
jgi:hypothetical protein